MFMTPVRPPIVPARSPVVRRNSATRISQWTAFIALALLLVSWLVGVNNQVAYQQPPPLFPPAGADPIVSIVFMDSVERGESFRNTLGAGMVWIAPGDFAMGDRSRRGDSDERPVHEVRLTSGFWLGETDVTNAQWKALMGTEPGAFIGGNRPVENVSWNDAVDFCKKLTAKERAAGRLPTGIQYRLPTEAQWEYACRAGTTGDFAGNLEAMAWHDTNSGSETHDVKMKRPNAWGLYDMHGNVWEWCADWYGSYSDGMAEDPTGVPTGALRVYRGGSWTSPAGYCRSASRGRNSPGFRNIYLGFRLAAAPAIE
jgi:formylglycine-generating enzyme required for sulfatase activity